MPVFEVLAAQDVPHYGAFDVDASTPDVALGAATVRLLAGRVTFSEAEWEGAHSLRIVSIRREGEEPAFCDLGLDPEAPLWPGRDIAEALRGSTTRLASLLGSLGEEAECLPELDQVEANLRLLGTPQAMELAALRAAAPADRWVEAVQRWGNAAGEEEVAGQIRS